MTDFSGELLTKDEVMSYLRTTKSSFHRAIKAGRIPEGVKITGKPLWAKKTIEKLINAKTFSN
jgi:predicted DNA-binding transcriptional regulator AlpA